MIVFGGTSATPILVEDPQAEIPVGGLGLFEGSDGKVMVRRSDGSTSDATMQDVLRMVVGLVVDRHL